MYDLTYNLLVDRVSKRKAQIFSILATSPIPLDVKFLIHQTNFSKRTISDYITEFNKERPYNMELSQNSKNEFTLKTKDPSSISLYLNAITENNPLFFIIERIYDNTFDTIESLSDHLYLSDSSVKRYLAHLKKELNQYDLNLALTPHINIVGDEITIRYFFFRYFRYVFDNSLLPIEAHQTNSVYQTIAKLISESGFALSIDYTRVSNLISIFEQRIKNGHDVLLSENIKKLHRDSDSFARFKRAFLPNFENNPDIGLLSENELMYAYILRLDALTYENQSTFFYADYGSQLAQFEPIVSNFLTQYHLHPGLYINLKITLQAFLMNTTFLTDLAPYYQELDKELHKQIQLSYPDMLKDWLEILDTHKITFKFVNDVAVSLTLITTSFLQMTSKKDLKVLFSFSGDPASIGYYKSTALKVVPRDAEVIFLFNKELNDELLTLLSIDICIVNFRIQAPISVCKVVKLSPIPLEVEWFSLLSTLYNNEK